MKTSKFGWPEVTGFLSVALVLSILLIPAEVGATAASTEVNTPTRTAVEIVLIQGSNIVYAGTMVCVDSSGLVEHATDAASKKVIGRAQETQDNTGSNYSATRTIKVRRGCFRWVNGDSFTDANIGDLAYVEDNQTVQKAASASQDIIAGVIIDVDSDGVWVDTHDIGSQGAGSLTTLATSGAATLGSTLSVASTAQITGAATLQSTANIAGAVVMSNTLNVAGASTLTGAAALGSTMSVAGNATFAKNVVITPATQPLEAGATTLTVTNSLYILEPSGVATVALANASAAGYTVTFVNNAGTNVVFAEAGNIHSAGDVTLGQYDSITFTAIAAGSWIQTGANNN
jgi:hypothetical protein